MRLITCWFASPDQAGLFCFSITSYPSPPAPFVHPPPRPQRMTSPPNLGGQMTIPPPMGGRGDGHQRRPNSPYSAQFTQATCLLLVAKGFWIHANTHKCSLCEAHGTNKRKSQCTASIHQFHFMRQRRAGGCTGLHLSNAQEMVVLAARISVPQRLQGVHMLHCHTLCRTQTTTVNHCFQICNCSIQRIPALGLNGAGHEERLLPGVAASNSVNIWCTSSCFHSTLHSSMLHLSW